MKEPMSSWAQIPEEELLKLRIKDLSLDLETSDIFPLVKGVLQELEAKELHLKPRIYFGDEWFSPEGVGAIAIPFFLAHPRLRTLEKKMMLECEGEDSLEFKKFFRHELGHAFDHAFKVSRRSSWVKIFGSPKKEYQPETYRPRPYSKNFVHNIGRWYAQAHPDEDFAETFAIWLDPNSDWKNSYKDWGAYKKLSYIDRLSEEFKNKKTFPARGKMISDANYLQSTLLRYYEKKRRHFAEDYPDFYDKDLLRIFLPKTEESLKFESASSFMKRNRKKIIGTIAHWTGEKKTTISDLTSRLIKRCAELKLVVPDEEAEVLLETSAFLATLVSHYLFTGHFRRTI
ncbi:MAG: hypothetical protein JWQ35_1965 [Bacteriovoracaceae bacterium]|nr:hypothetical protein [Bacteriovoracaceae bacterium]